MQFVEDGNEGWVNERLEVKNVNKIIEAIKRHAKERPESLAYTVYDEAEESFSQCSMTWGKLDTYSDRLSGYILEHTKKAEPIIVYGHKNPYMMVCFMACVKAGHAYVPVDVSVPLSRAQDIVDSVGPEIILTTEESGFSVPASCEALNLDIIEAISNDDQYQANEDKWLMPQDVFYIIFTSGSTGKPKGVQITTECLVNYVEWAQNLGGGGTRSMSIAS